MKGRMRFPIGDQ